MLSSEFGVLNYHAYNTHKYFRLIKLIPSQNKYKALSLQVRDCDQ